MMMGQYHSGPCDPAISTRYVDPVDGGGMGRVAEDMISGEVGIARVVLLEHGYSSSEAELQSLVESEEEGAVSATTVWNRWTKSARGILGPLASDGSDVAALLFPVPFRHNIMYVSVLELVKMGDLGEKNYRIVMKHIKACKKELWNSESDTVPLYLL